MAEATSDSTVSDPFRVESLDHLVLTVADVEASAAFYETVCGMVTGPRLSVHLL